MDKSHLFYFVAIKRLDIYQTLCIFSLFVLVGLNSLVLTSQHDLYFLVCLALLLSRTILQIDVEKREKREKRKVKSFPASTSTEHCHYKYGILLPLYCHKQTPEATEEEDDGIHQESFSAPRSPPLPSPNCFW